MRGLHVKSGGNGTGPPLSYEQKPTFGAARMDPVSRDVDDKTERSLQLMGSSIHRLIAKWVLKWPDADEQIPNGLQRAANL